MTKTFLYALALGFTAYSCSGQKQGRSASEVPANTLNKKEKAAGWKLLFDGKTTAGWHSYGTTGVGDIWKTEDGTIHFDAAAKKNGAKGDLVTDDSYSNFELQLEWKASPGANSGIIFLVQDDKAKYPDTYLTGPEMQVLDNIAATDNKNPKHLAGALYDLIDAKSTSKPNPVGTWNRAVIKLQHGNLELKLNDIVTARVTIGSPEWDQLVAGSKFAKWPGFAKFKSGHIALQDHGHDVWFRNIKIRTL